MLGLLALAVTAFTAFASTASATRVTSPTGTLYTGKIHAVSVGHAVLHSSSISTVECASTIEGEITSHGTGVTATGPVKALTFTGCTGNNTVTAVNKLGTLEAHWTSGYNGTLTASGQEVTVFNHSFNGTCIYSTTNTEIGPITGGKPAFVHTKTGGAVINRTGGSLGVFCGSTGTWTATYEVKTPTELYLDH